MTIDEVLSQAAAGQHPSATEHTPFRNRKITKLKSILQPALQKAGEIRDFAWLSIESFTKGMSLF
jgi:hypothetical protein